MSRSVKWYVLLWVGIALIAAGCTAPAAVTPEPESESLPSPGPAWRHHWLAFGGLSKVYDLAVDGEWLWVATSGGLVQVNQRTLTYEQFSHTGTSPDVPLDRVYTLLLDGQGRLWVGGGHGLVRYDGDLGWSAIYTADWVGAFALDANDKLLRLSFHRGGGVNCELLQGHGPPTRYEWKYVTELEPTQDNCEAWHFLATYNWKYGSPAECAAAIRRREQLSSLALPEEPGPVSLPYDKLIAEDADGAYWFWSSYGFNTALVRYDGEAVQTIPWPWTDVNAHAIVAAGVKDGVWIRTEEGLFYSDGRTIQQYLFVAGRLIPRGPDVHSLAVTSAGHVWASTSNGLFRFDEEREEWQSVAGGEKEIVIKESVPIAPDGQGGLWALHSGNLVHFDGQTWRFWPLPAEIKSCEVHAVTEFHGEVWVAAGECGLWRFDGQVWDRPALDITALALIQGRDGKLYAQESESSPYVYNGENWIRLPERGWKEIQAPAPPPVLRPCDQSSNSVSCVSSAPQQGQKVPVPIAIDAEGNVWAASETHVWYHSPDGEWLNVLQLPRKSSVTSLLVDSQGSLWVGGRRGLLHYDGDGWETVDFPDDVFVSFFTTTLAQDQQGRIWVGGRNGLSVYDPTEK